ncbi:poly-beta-1,6-N-acetyl-D-glucosamine N-deacetylase PgaB [Serratia sp. S1B]|nr:poly-beta-1,6-N-acetyl-D-glucosamine N-deacetylase PgaB [Serratia sp. S1B]
MIKFNQTILPYAFVLSSLLSVQTYAAAPDSILGQNQSIALNFHNVREDVLKKDDADLYAVNSRSLAEFFDWLSHSKWHPVSLQQIIDAREGKKPLPPNAIVLSFDDGLVSGYTQVFPLLKEYKFPAVFGIMTGWTNKTTKFDDEITYKNPENFMTWDEMREMQKSGLVDFVSHTDSLHIGILANPQGNEEPSAITRQYLKNQQRYETDQEYQQRVYNDLLKSKQILEKQLGMQVKAVIWPYGAVTPETEDIAKKAGLPISFSLGRSGINQINDRTYKRILMLGNPDSEGLQQELLNVVNYHEDSKINIRHSLSIKLDDLIGPAGQYDDNRLGLMLDRLQALAVNKVFVDVFDQSNEKVFFPNTIFPMSQDAMNRFTWQVQTRLYADVYANISLSYFKNQPQKLNPFVMDLMKNNTSLSGIFLESDGDLSAITTPEKMKWFDKVKQTAEYYSNVSKTFRFGLRVPLTPDLENSMDNVLPNLMNHFEFVNFILDQPADKQQTKMLKKVFGNLPLSTKSRISFSIDTKNLKSESDWKAAQKTLIDLQGLGIQNIGANQYNLENGMFFHKYLYTPLSQNDSPLNYKNPFKNDMNLEKVP